VAPPKERPARFKPGRSPRSPSIDDSRYRELIIIATPPVPTFGIVAVVIPSDIGGVHRRP